MSLGQKVKFKLIRLFLSESSIGGITIMLPLAIIAFFFNWLMETLNNWISPFAHVLDRFHLPIFITDLCVIILVIMLCAALGHLVRTRMGSWVYIKIENAILRELPGYRILKDMTQMVLGKDSSPFRGEVARVWLYGREIPTWTIALITSRHADGSYSAFVPTAPSPASGVVYHLSEDQVEIHSDITIDQAFKIIIACGAGSSKLFEKLLSPEKKDA